MRARPDDPVGTVRTITGQWTAVQGAEGEARVWYIINTGAEIGAAMPDLAEWDIVYQPPEE